MAPALPFDTGGETDEAGIAAISAELARAAETLQALRGDSAAWSASGSRSCRAPTPGRRRRSLAPIGRRRRARARLRVRSGGRVHAMLAEAARCRS